MKELWKRINSDTRLAAVFYGVIASLLASAVIKYSPLALTIIGQYTLGALTNFIDSRYAKAATLEPTNYSYYLLTVIFVVIVIAWMEISSKIKKNLKKPKISTASKEEPIKKSTPETSKWIPKAFLGVRTLIWLHLSWGFLYVAGEATVLNAITDFNQHIRIVTPYIEPKEKDLLISDWSQKRKLDDYNDIYIKLVRIAKENDLKLYKNKQY